MRHRFRTVWISDIHLGSNTVRGADLSFFLRHVMCERLYLVGDIVDMWRLRKRWRWPACHNDVVRRLLKLASKGVDVVWIPGNHDDAIRPYDGLSIGVIRIELMAAHETADGKRMLVTHVDQHDLVVCASPALAAIGSLGYDLLLGMNRVWNGLRRRVGLPYQSLSQSIKARVKSACTMMSRYEDALIAEARRGGFDGVAEGVAEVEECASAVGTGLAFVASDDAGLDFDAAADHARQKRMIPGERCVLLQETEEIGVGDEAVLDHLGHARGELARR
jgi:UDP-2,3-diacylglucosamine pyrophosphatase LpxH